jgi:hypothetical protein
MLAVSEYLSSKAQDTQAQKEEAILYLIARIGVLNGFYSTGKYQNEPRALANYQKMSFCGRVTMPLGEHEPPRLGSR